MEVQLITYPHPDLSLQKSDNLFTKDLDDFRTFEEAFDPISLRKFFQEHESTNSQSAYSPCKEISFSDDNHSQTTADHDTLSSPISQYLMKNTPNETIELTPNLIFNFDLNPNLIKQCVQSSPNQEKVRHAPFIIQRVPHKSIKSPTPRKTRNTKKQSKQKKTDLSKIEDNDIGKFIYSDYEIPVLIPKQLQTPFRKEESKFEKLLRTKRVFKIERETKQISKPINIKRRASTPAGEGPLPIVKKTKSHTSNVESSNEEKVFFSFNLPIRQNLPVYQNISNYFNVFEDRQVPHTYNIPTPFHYENGSRANQKPNFQQIYHKY